MTLVDTSIVSTPDRTAWPDHTNRRRRPTAEAYETLEETLSSTNTYTKQQWIAEQAREQRTARPPVRRHYIPKADGNGEGGTQRGGGDEAELEDRQSGKRLLDGGQTCRYGAKSRSMKPRQRYVGLPSEALAHGQEHWNGGERALAGGPVGGELALVQLDQVPDPFVTLEHRLSDSLEEGLAGIARGILFPPDPDHAIPALRSGIGSAAKPTSRMSASTTSAIPMR